MVFILVERNTGTKIFCISGHVNNPCNVEEEWVYLSENLLKNMLRLERWMG